VRKAFCIQRTREQHRHHAGTGTYIRGNTSTHAHSQQVAQTQHTMPACFEATAAHAAAAPQLCGLQHACPDKDARANVCKHPLEARLAPTVSHRCVSVKSGDLPDTDWMRA